MAVAPAISSDRTGIPLPAGQSAGAVLRVDGIHKKFGGTYALQDISFSVDRGEVLALLGENGAGKSTLIKILAGVHELDQGEVIFDGEVATRHITDLPIAFIHQDLGLIDWMTVAENVCLTRGFDRRFGLIDWERCRRTAPRGAAADRRRHRSRHAGALAEPDRTIPRRHRPRDYRRRQGRGDG